MAQLLLLHLLQQCRGLERCCSWSSCSCLPAPSCCCRRLRLRSNAVAIRDAHARGQRAPVLQAQPASAWLLWRVAFDVHWRRLPRDEAMALAAVARGDAFADWCARLPGPAPALRAASLLKRWLADGLVTGLSFSS